MSIRLRLAGDLDAYVAEEVRELFLDVIDRHDDDVRLDLSEVDFIDSSGVGAIVFLYKRLAAAGRRLSLVNAQGQPKALIETLSIHRTIEVTQDAVC